MNPRERCRFLVLFCFSILLVACASSPPPQVIKRQEIPRGSELAVVSFRDCMIAGQEDCDGSGNVAGSIFARVFSETQEFRAVPLSRPVGAKDNFTDDDASEYAASKGFEFVINGEVDEYYTVAPMTFRTDRAGISVRILRTSDGSVVAFYSERKEGSSNLTTPDRIIEKMAERIRDGL